MPIPSCFYKRASFATTTTVLYLLRVNIARFPFAITFFSLHSTISFPFRERSISEPLFPLPRNHSTCRCFCKDSSWIYTKCTCVILLSVACKNNIRQRVEEVLVSLRDSYFSGLLKHIKHFVRTKGNTINAERLRLRRL